METTKSINDLSLGELEALMKDKKREEEQKRKKAQQDYEMHRDATISWMSLRATQLAKELEQFMEDARLAMDHQQAKLNEYGKIRSSSKGGFTIETADGAYRIVRQYRAINDYDERATKAEELLKDFLQDTVKKKDKDLFEMIMSLLERNKAGKLEYSRIQSLYKHEGKYNDPRWLEAIKLFKESFNQKGSKLSIYFYKRDEQGVYQPINLNFSTL